MDFSQFHFSQLTIQFITEQLNDAFWKWYGTIDFDKKRSGHKLIKKRLTKHIEETLNEENKQIELFKEEKVYAEKHELVPEGFDVVVKDGIFAFRMPILSAARKKQMRSYLLKHSTFWTNQRTI